MEAFVAERFAAGDDSAQAVETCVGGTGRDRSHARVAQRDGYRVRGYSEGRSGDVRTGGATQRHGMLDAELGPEPCLDVGHVDNGRVAMPGRDQAPD